MTTFSSFAFRALPALALLGLASCQADIDTPNASPGSANFGRYLAVGNSLTAGFGDNGLYLEGQQNSYPSMLAQQFAQAGGGAFYQPLFASNQADGSGYLRLAGFTAAGAPITATVPANAGRTTATAAPYTKYLSQVDNLGVPGIRLADIQTAGYGSTAGNPYFERITSDATQTYFQRIKAEVAGTVNIPAVTFFSCWLGNNDVLGYATAGGAVASSGITRTDTFALKATRVINALTANRAKGIVSNIPDVTGIPFFTTVGPSARASFAAANVPAAAPFIYTTGILAPGAANTRVTTATLGSIRNATSGTLLLTLTSSPYIGLYGQPTGRYWRDFYRQATGSAPTGAAFGGFLTALGIDTTRAFGQSTLNPFPSTLVLDDTEQANVAAATTAFNNSLQTAAAAKGLAYFDANTFFRGVATNNQVINGVATNNASFISGNLFSLDGVHPTPRGYALIANEMIKAINAQYGASIRPVNPTNYRGVRFP